MRQYLMRRKLIYIFLILLLIVTTSSATYAIFTASTVQSGTNSLSTLSCLDVSFQNQENIINMINTYPMTQDKALSRNPYSFTIKNNCSYGVSMEINLESLNLNNDTQIPKGYIMVAIKSTDMAVPSVNLLSTLASASVENNNTNYTSNNLLTNVDLAGASEKNFELWLWIKQDITEEQVGNKINYQGKIVVRIHPKIQTAQ